jgi:NhaA family Na+:H+ antiporter
VRRRPGLSGFLDLLALETAPGIVLLLATLIALGWANSPFAAWYSGLRELHASVRVGALRIDEPLLLWINDGLMAVFFLLVGLEIKRELLEGELSSLRKAILPAIAAAGGMIGPALIYLACNMGDPIAMRGWAIPTATDIAFAAGLLSLLGSRVPRPLRAFLIALAIMDDLGAIAIIAIVYTGGLSQAAVLLAGLCLLVLLLLNRCGVTRLAPYVLAGVALWVCVLKSGVHATLAGVALAAAIPLDVRSGASPLHRMEQALAPYVTWGIVPLFALANGGVPLRGLSIGDLFGPIPLGTALGLLLGKQAGIMAASWAAVRARIAHLPAGTGWGAFHGVAILAGVGFTMSLFITALAFGADDPGNDARIGVLAGSLISATLGLVLLRWLLPGRGAQR